MLSTLTIKNFGLIDEVTLDFHESLNVFTGQTGAGKSILLEGVRVALGGRFTAEQVRDLSKPSVVEAVFELAGTEVRQNPLIQEYILQDESELILLRTFDSKGRSKTRINGLTASLSQLKKIGSLLLDFHGAHDHQMLLSEESHLNMLDRLIPFGKLKEDYSKTYQTYEILKRKQKELEEMRQTRERELDILTHQITELEQVPLTEEHYQNILQEESRIQNGEKLTLHTGQLLDLLEEQPNSCLEQLRRLFGPMRQLSETDPQTSPLAETLNQFQELGNELSYQLREYADTFQFNSAQAGDIHNQADIYHDLIKKYGRDFPKMSAYYEEIRAKEELLKDFDFTVDDIEKKMNQQKKELSKIAKEISAKRKKGALTLKKTIESELNQLGITHARFEVRFESQDFMKTGQDSVTFYLSPNAGVDLKPLSAIVSSGEAARVMLALKKALIKVDPVPVLIFDEIDAQIGGRLGQVTGEKLRDIARYRQVLLITHLPQIASFANHHYKVSKASKAKKTTTTCSLLDDDARIDELAEMMDGSRESEISLRHAQEMLVHAKK